MRWIVLQQVENDTVKYVTSEKPDAVYVNYQEFMSFVTQYNIQDWYDFQKTLNKFEVIVLKTDTGRWEVRDTIKNNEYSLNELIELQETIQKKKDFEKNRDKKILNVGKDLVNNFAKHRKNNFKI